MTTVRFAMEQPFDTSGLGENHTELVLHLNNSLGLVNLVNKVLDNTPYYCLYLLNKKKVELQPIERKGSFFIGEEGVVGFRPRSHRPSGPGALCWEELCSTAPRLFQDVL